MNPKKYTMGIEEASLPMVYFFGGLATLITSPLMGKFADRFGKHRIFRINAFFTIWPVIWLTSLHERTPTHWILAATTLLFIFMNGRMSPAMALMSAIPAPGERGGFLSINSAVQQAFTGLGAWVAGLMVSHSRLQPCGVPCRSLWHLVHTLDHFLKTQITSLDSESRK